MKVHGKLQASLTSCLIVRQISLSVFMGHDYAIGWLFGYGVFTPLCECRLPPIVIGESKRQKLSNDENKKFACIYPVNGGRWICLRLCR
jgi:hypothetical protein